MPKIRHKVKRICEQCGIEFERYPSQAKRFCSKTCMFKGQAGAGHPNYTENVKCICAYCGKNIEKKQHEIKHYQATYCNAECHNNAQRGVEHVARVKRKCKQCSKEFEARPSKPGQFCSKECRYKNRDNRVERTCIGCNNTFMAYPSSIKYHGAKYCSKECKDKRQRGINSPVHKEKPKRVCVQCKKTFEIDGWRLKDSRSSRGQFCSTICRSKYMVGEHASNYKGEDKLKSNLYNWRQSVLKRDKYTCVWCGAIELLQADHIKPLALFPELKTDINNGRTLCIRCHKKTNTYGSKVKLLKKEDFI